MSSSSSSKFHWEIPPKPSNNIPNPSNTKLRTQLSYEPIESSSDSACEREEEEILVDETPAAQKNRKQIIIESSPNSPAPKVAKKRKVEEKGPQLTSSKYAHQLEQLKFMFPDRQESDLLRILDEKQGNVESAIDALFENSPVLSGLSSPGVGFLMSKKTKSAVVVSDDDVEDKEFVVKNKSVAKASSKNDSVESLKPIEILDSEPDLHQSETVQSSPMKDSTAEKKATQFFNTATASQLSDFTRCSEAQTKKIVSLRPFSDYDDLNEKLNDTKGVSLKLLENYFESLEAFEVIDELIAKCDSLTSEITRNLRKWSSSSSSGFQEVDDEAGVHFVEFSDEVMDDIDKEGEFSVIRRQPAGLNPKYRLKNYQLLGINWLWLMHQKIPGCILADDMGLGKTAQIIAFITHLVSRGIDGPYLIVVPASTTDNWIREFTNWSPELIVESYYGMSYGDKVYGLAY